jgi:DNA-binding transcriptional MerR regulator
MGGLPVVGKSAQAFRTISEVSEELGVQQHVLRFWESRFTQVRPLKRGGGRRYYRPDDIDLLRAIKSLLYDHGYTIKGVQKIMKETGPRQLIDSAAGLEAGTPVAAQAPARPNGASVDSVISELEEIRDLLRDV